MPVRIINIMLDEGEYAYAMSKKGKRTWKAIFLDGIEYKVYHERKVPPEPSTRVGTYSQTRPSKKSE